MSLCFYWTRCSHATISHILKCKMFSKNENEIFLLKPSFVLKTKYTT